MKGANAPTIATRSSAVMAAASRASAPASIRPPGTPCLAIARAERALRTATATARLSGDGDSASRARLQASCPTMRPAGGAAAAERGQQTVSARSRGVNATPVSPVAIWAAV